MGRKAAEGNKASWDRHGDDCACILKGLNAEGGFNDWSGFEKDPSFPAFEAKCKLVNLKRNFKKTVEERHNAFKAGSGGKKDRRW